MKNTTIDIKLDIKLDDKLKFYYCGDLLIKEVTIILNDLLFDELNEEMNSNLNWMLYSELE